MYKTLFFGVLCLTLLFSRTPRGLGLGLELVNCSNFLGQNQALANKTNPPFRETVTNNQKQTLVKIWNISTFLGVIGTILNGIILINFYLERNAIFKVVNVMIW